MGNYISTVFFELATFISLLAMAWPMPAKKTADVNTQPPCQIMVDIGKAAIQANPNIDRKMFGLSLVGKILNDPRKSTEAKAAALNEFYFLENQPASSNEALRLACGLPKPSGSIDNYFRRYGTFGYVIPLGQSKDLWIIPVLGGTPETDFKTEANWVTDGSEAAIFSADFNFGIKESVEADEIFPLKRQKYVITYTVTSGVKRVFEMNSATGRVMFVLHTTEGDKIRIIRFVPPVPSATASRETGGAKGSSLHP